MATIKRAFTLRLNEDVFEKIGVLAAKEHRSVTNYIEFVLLEHLSEREKLEKNSLKKKVLLVRR